MLTKGENWFKVNFKVLHGLVDRWVGVGVGGWTSGQVRDYNTTSWPWTLRLLTKGKNWFKLNFKVLHGWVGGRVGGWMGK